MAPAQTTLAGARPGAHSHGRPPSTGAAERFRSADPEDFDLPTGREEEWRFTPLRRLRGLHADAEFRPSATRCDWTEPEPVRIEAVDGPGLSKWRGLTGYVPTELTAARILAEVPSSLTVDVPAGAQLAEPIVITLTGTDAELTEAGHIAVRVGPNAQATIVLRHHGSAALAQLVEILVEDGARATVLTVQEWADDAVHLVRHAVRVGRDASLTHMAVTLGGRLVRLGVDVDYAGPGGSAELYGVYFSDAGQHLEHRLWVDHAVPDCRSRVEYRGALQGADAHAVWVGDVVIRAGATGTDTYELNRNLILTEGARADSIPNLEIETGEIVGAGHASATGRFDDEQLFYLQSRGIPADEARRLVVRAFFATLLQRIGDRSISDPLMDSIETRLSRA